jgi:acetyl-CoA carboxylase/biotin carboxylase 1
MLAILETIQNANLNTSEGSPLQKVLKALADMPSKINAASKVSLKAREILISSSLPSYEERRLQMEKILVSSVTTSYYGESGGGHKQPSIDILNELSNSRFTVYDVLSFFFKHEDPWVVLASLTVYVLRAYREYSILDIRMSFPSLRLSSSISV